MSPTDIVYVSSRPPHATGKGDALTCHHYVRMLAERGWNVHLRAQRWWNDTYDADVPDLGDGSYREQRVHRHDVVSRRFLAGWFSGWPLQAALGSRATYDLLSDDLAMEHGGVVYAHYLRTVLPALSWGVPAPRLVAGLQLTQASNLEKLSERGFRHSPSSWIKRIEANRCTRAERSLGHLSAVVFTSQADVAFLELEESPNTHVISHGVVVGSRPERSATTTQPTMIMSGVMSFGPNADGAAWFVDNVIEHVRRRVPNAKLRIVGRDPSPQVRALESEYVEVVGPVDEMPRELRAANVAIVPVRIAAGMQNKLLEAAEAGLPVVTTPEGNAATRFPNQTTSNPCVIEAGSIQEWTDALSDLLTNDDRSREVGAAAREHVEKEWSWERRFDSLERLLRDADGASGTETRHGV